MTTEFSDTGPSRLGLSSGDQLGEWLLEKLLGRGSHGEVWSAVNAKARGFTIRRALKVVQLSTDDDWTDVSREAAAQDGLSHDHIARFYSFLQHDSFLCLVLELVEGETLRRRLRRGPLAPTDAARVFGALAGALAYAHASDLAHGDIKPSNIMVGLDGRAKLIDFGVARALQPEGRALGATMAYVSPEWARSEPITQAQMLAAQDIYALGQCLYEALTWTHPFSGTDEEILRQKREQGVPLDPKGSPESLRAIVRRATHPDWIRRPPGADLQLSLAALVPADEPTLRPRKAGEPAHAATLSGRYAQRGDDSAPSAATRTGTRGDADHVPHIDAAPGTPRSDAAPSRSVMQESPGEGSKAVDSPIDLGRDPGLSAVRETPRRRLKGSVSPTATASPTREFERTGVRKEPWGPYPAVLLLLATAVALAVIYFIGTSIPLGPQHSPPRRPIHSPYVSSVSPTPPGRPVTPSTLSGALDPASYPTFAGLRLAPGLPFERQGVRVQPLSGAVAIRPGASRVLTYSFLNLNDYPIAITSHYVQYLSRGWGVLPYRSQAQPIDLTLQPGRQATWHTKVELPLEVVALVEADPAGLLIQHSTFAGERETFVVATEQILFKDEHRLRWIIPSSKVPLKSDGTPWDTYSCLGSEGGSGLLRVTPDPGTGWLVGPPDTDLGADPPFKHCTVPELLAVLRRSDNWRHRQGTLESMIIQAGDVAPAFPDAQKLLIDMLRSSRNEDFRFHAARGLAGVPTTDARRALATCAREDGDAAVRALCQRLL